MRLHLRKSAEQSVKDSKDTPGFPALDRYEEWIIESAAEDDPAIGLGRMVSLATDLLEIARRADPAYGLTRVDA